MERQKLDIVHSVTLEAFTPKKYGDKFAVTENAGPDNAGQWQGWKMQDQKRLDDKSWRMKQL